MLIDVFHAKQRGEYPTNWGEYTMHPLPDYLTKVRTKMIYRLSNVEIIWPKLDVPYWYDKTAPNPFDPSKTGYDVRVEKTDKRGSYQCAF